jgi:hypothetical protein
MSNCNCGVTTCTMGRKRVNHGTMTAYDLHGCRCYPCVFEKKMRSYRYIKKRLSSGNINHGTYYAYSRLGCRCADCTESMRSHMKKYTKQSKKKAVAV